MRHPFRHPFRHACFQVAEKLGWSLEEVMTKLTAQEVYEWMAYEMTKDEKFRDDYRFTTESADEAMLAVFGG